MLMNERIKSMRKLKNLTLLEVAEKLGVKEATMQRYESGEIKNIKHETIVQLADIFECSPIYLIGWCESPSCLESDSDMAKRIKELRLSLCLTLEEVANQVGVGKSTVRKWETGIIANMRCDKIAALAKALHTTPGYLMGWTDEQAISPVSKSICKQIEDKFGKNAATALSLYVQLDEIDQVRITERMSILLENEKYSPKTKNGTSPA